jgi:hypothetical protein
MALSDRHRHELIAIVALLAGLFIGVALIAPGATGPVLPAAGLAAGLVGLGWLGGIDLRRIGILAGGMILVAPYLIGVAVLARQGAAGFPLEWSQWTLIQRSVGIVPAMLVAAARDGRPESRRGSGGRTPVDHADDEEPDAAGALIEERAPRTRAAKPAVVAKPPTRRPLGPPARRSAVEGEGEARPSSTGWARS